MTIKCSHIFVSRFPRERISHPVRHIRAVANRSSITTLLIHEMPIPLIIQHSCISPLFHTIPDFISHGEKIIIPLVMITRGSKETSLLAGQLRIIQITIHKGSPVISHNLYSLCHHALSGSRYIIKRPFQMCPLDGQQG